MGTISNKILAERLRKARRSRDLTQIDVSERTGINSATLSGYERGISEPNVAVLKKLADAYGVSIEWLVGYGSDNPYESLHHKPREDEGYSQDIRRLFRAAKSMTSEEAQKTWAVLKAIFPEKFEDD